MVRRERRISQPALISRLRSKSVGCAAGGITYRHLGGASPLLRRKLLYRKLLRSQASVSSSFFSSNFLEQLLRCTLHATPEVSHEVRRSALLPFSARATFHPDCTVGTGFSPVRPLLRAGVSSGVLASCADAKIHTIFCLPAERFAGCDRRFGISPTPEHDVDIDYATAHAGGLICFLWDNFRDKMTLYDCILCDARELIFAVRLQKSSFGYRLAAPLSTFRYCDVYIFYSASP